MIKVGLIGCGMIAELGHLPAIQQSPGLVLESLYDPRWERALDMQRRFHAKHAYPTEEAFWNCGFDVVVICTPAPLHLEHVIKAAKHGKHILCEKPLAMTVNEIEEMISVTNAAKVKLYTGFTYRFSPSALEIHRLVRSGAIGEVRSLRLIYLWNLHGKWQFDSSGTMIPSKLRVGRMEEGGPMVDCGVHQIDLARWWLCSEVNSARGIGVWVEDFEAPDHMYLHMGHENGAHTMVEMSFSYNATSKEPRSNFQYELIGTDGVIRLNREEHSFELRNSHGTRYLPWHPEKNFMGMYHELLFALTHQEDRNMPLAMDGLVATKIARQATNQAISEREVGSSKNHSKMIIAEQGVTTSNIPADSSEPAPSESGQNE
ncbi:MAG: Gfo/Idh/MocA family oxidoreductase [Bacteroidota bacterium]